MTKEKLCIKKECLKLEEDIERDLSRGKCMKKVIHTQTILFEKRIKQLVKDKYDKDCHVDVNSQTIIDYKGDTHIIIEIEISFGDEIMRFTTNIE